MNPLDTCAWTCLPQPQRPDGDLGSYDQVTGCMTGVTHVTGVTGMKH